MKQSFKIALSVTHLSPMREKKSELKKAHSTQNPEVETPNQEVETPNTELDMVEEDMKENFSDNDENPNLNPNSSPDLNLTSPRGVLEIPISGSDSDQSSSCISESGSTCGSSSFKEEKSTMAEGETEADAAGEEDDVVVLVTSPSGGVQWKSMIDNLKWKSFRRLSTIPTLLGGYEISKKSLRKKIPRFHSSDAAACGDDVLAIKPSWRNFTLQELAAATNNFSPDNLIGHGGHAEVYKGCLPDGQIVAVKKITKKEKKDEDRVGDFLAELGIIAHINHPNAARLIGFSSDGDLHLILQFAPHGSLSTLLHGSKETIDWNLRFKVAMGVAEGLQYLHCDCHRRIIHRDITASNILLTEDYEPQISDFGLAKWLPEKWVHHVVSPIEGTFGYMAPEYFMHGVVHEKTDVFAFGVLLLELITGRRAVDSSQQSLVIWAKPLLEEGNVKELVDPRLGDTYDLTEMKRAMYTASSCIHHLPNSRPNMQRVVQLLKGENMAVELRQQKTMGGRALLVDACDLEDYTSTTYQKDLNRHMELVME